MYHIASFCFIVKESMDDKLDRLATRVYEGDIKAFDTIDEYLRPQIVRMSYKYSNTYNNREDVEQDMMESALRLCYRYKHDRGRYRHYVLRSVRFEMISRLRNYNARGKKEYLRKDQSIDLEVGDCVDSDSTDPVDLLVKEEQLTYLLGDNSVCSPLEKKILTFFGNGWSIDGISEELKLNRKTVSNSLYRIRRKKERLVLDREPGAPFDNMG